MEHRIIRVEEDSIAQQVGIEAGDILLSINGAKIEDILDYKSALAEEDLLVLVEKNTVLYEYDIEKYPGEDLGLVFETITMDEVKTCRNKCLFCFVDQLPAGMRETLYVKDDDYRLSLICGNYITLTNLTELDLKRIIEEKISPLYISIHTLNPNLRQKMLNNKRAAKIMEQLTALKEGGISFHGQVVLCPGVNDGAELEATLKGLEELHPALLSLSLVPVGMTGHRETLYPLKGYTPARSFAVITACETWQERFYKSFGTNLVYVADEFYLSADRQVPPAAHYGGFPQLENGVGLVRLLLDEYAREKDNIPRELAIPYHFSIACGASIYKILKVIVDDLNRVKNLSVRLYPIKNRFFGSEVTVTGLLTGSDLRRDLQGKELGEGLFFSRVMLKEGRDVFLDNVSPAHIQKALDVPVTPVDGVSELICMIAARGIH